MNYIDAAGELIHKYPLIYEFAVVFLVICGCGVVDFLLRKVILRGLKQVFSRLSDGDTSEQKLVLKMASKLAKVVPAVILYYVPDIFLNDNALMEKIVQELSIILLIVFLTQTLMILLDIADKLYQKRENAQARPIKGYLQLGKILLIIIAAILGISSLLDKSPVLWLSGLGAVAAVLMLIFQDTILSLVASIQLNSNNMVKIGDWIVMPAYEVDGFVIEIALHTVKVQNWDKTIVTVPTRKLIEGSFINWRGMFESGGRRIKRSLYIDQRSIRFLSEEEIRKLEEFVLLNDYLEAKHKEIADWNAELAAKGVRSINSRRITNIGTFRIYVEKYLRSNKNINQEMLMLVRQLAPGPTGLPLEIYCFTKSTQWIEYEQAQADLFDHLLAILPEFGLRVFQEISDTPTLVEGEGK